MVIDRLWKKGDQIEIEFPMPVQKVISHPMVSENNGKIALERGPLVYCAESIDNNGTVLNMLIPETADFQVSYQGDLLNGVSVIRGLASIVQEQDPDQLRSATLTAIPYYAWANRGSGEMRVWFPVVKPEKQ